jgi:hypothetical protein
VKRSTVVLEGVDWRGAPKGSSVKAFVRVPAESAVAARSPWAF